MKILNYFNLITSNYYPLDILRYYIDDVGTGFTLKDGSATNLSLTLEHLFCIKWLQLSQKTELLAMPLLQILHGHFTGSDLAGGL